MANEADILRELASVRRDLEDLSDEVSNAENAMPRDRRMSNAGRQNFLTVLKRLEKVEEMAGETAESLRSAIKKMDG